MSTAWYLLPADTLIASSQSWSAPAGTPGSATSYAFWNNRSGTGASALTSLYFRAVAQITDPDTSSLVWRDQGVPVLDNHEVEVRIVQGLNKTGVVASAWTPLGKGRSLVAPDLGNDEGLELELRINPTSDSASDAAVIALRAYSSLSTPTADGFVDSGSGGVLTRLGDSATHYLVSCEGVVENPGGADDQVQIGDFVGVAQGHSVAGLIQLVTVSDVDGDAATLVSGESYWAALSIAPDSSITQTKGSKAAADPVQPDFPTDEIPLAHVLRGFDALINTVDISEVWTLHLYALTVVSGRQVEVSSGRSMVGDQLGIPTGTTPLTLDASTTSTVYLLPDGSLSFTSDGTKPSSAAEAIYAVACNTTDVTSVVDLRRLRGTGDLHHLNFTITRSGGLQVGDLGILVWPHQVTGELRLIDPLVLALHDSGSGLTSGSLLVDIEVSEAGGAWTSLFPESGTDDRRPDVAWNATDPVSRTSTTGNAVIPTTRTLPAWSRVRARVAAVPAGTTPPAGVTVTLLVETARV